MRWTCADDVFPEECTIDLKMHSLFSKQHFLARIFTGIPFTQPNPNENKSFLKDKYFGLQNAARNILLFEDNNEARSSRLFEDKAESSNNLQRRFANVAVICFF